ncbi:MAG: MucB/RseB C-terminal domain-containing protein [Comamonas sp.]
MQQTVNDWLGLLQAAPRQHAYTGEVEVSLHGQTSRSRLAHVRAGDGRFVDRIETLGERPRIVYRQHDEVLTLWPQSGQAVRETRDPLLSFPNLLQGPAGRLTQFYAVRLGNTVPVAGHAARETDLFPLDGWRYRLRVWAEARTGLPVKVQTLDGQARVLEQSVFTALDLSPRPAGDPLAQRRRELKACRIKASTLERTTPQEQGWRLASGVPGFEAVSCYRRLLDEAGGQAAMQWIFSDGLASVSLFLQPFDSQRHVREVQLAQGATHVLTRRIQDWWLTAVGEVPARTLRALAHGLERLS